MTVETRAGEDGASDAFVVRGYAAKYNQETVIAGAFREVVRPGFFDGVLGQDVRALFNHMPSMILGRTKSGTLVITTDEVGLVYEYVTPNRSYAIDLADAISKGDISESSFAFKASKENW